MVRRAAPGATPGADSPRDAQRLDGGKFISPSASDGAVSISAAQMAYMLKGIDWRNPQLSWRPQSAG
ncbi:IS66 family insertion sequence element accessory protein TnpB [Bradyrhizobium vignae]|uniref:IS66 family insertion sequence element accessory protein TnpB n=1 Tax=Bradyrhizobium vignae TaxID=1549949 RepID=UPI000F00B17F